MKYTDINKEKGLTKIGQEVNRIMEKYYARNPKESQYDFNHAFFWAVLTNPKTGRPYKTKQTLLTHSGPWKDLAAMEREIETIPGIAFAWYRLD